MKKAMIITVLLAIAFSTKAHVNLLNPSGGEIYNPGDTVEIQWQIAISHALQNWDLFFSEDGGSTWDTIQIDIPSTGNAVGTVVNYTWVVPDIITSQARIWVYMDNTGTDYDDESPDFTIAANVQITNPIGGETFIQNDIVNVQWEFDIGQSPLNFDLLFSEDGGVNWDTLQANIPAGTLSYQWTVPAIATTLGRIKIVLDNAGNDYEDMSGNFIIATFPTGVNEKENTLSLSIFPNPFTNNTTIFFDNPKNEKHTLIIQNVNGQIVRTVDNITGSVLSLERGKLSAGLYTYRLVQKNAKQMYNGKFIIR